MIRRKNAYESIYEKPWGIGATSPHQPNKKEWDGLIDKFQGKLLGDIYTSGSSITGDNGGFFGTIETNTAALGDNKKTCPI